MTNPNHLCEGITNQNKIFHLQRMTAGDPGGELEISTSCRRSALGISTQVQK